MEIELLKMLGLEAMVLGSVGCMAVVVMAQILIMKSAHYHHLKDILTNLNCAVNVTAARYEWHGCVENA